MHQPQTKKKKAFTLVELIIVITILAILGTIAFISFQGYTKDTRDSVRLTDVKSIYDGLSIYKVQTSTTLLPDDYIEIQSGTTTISYQGYAGDTVQRGINLKNGGTDPLSKNYYIYTTDVQAKKIQLLTYLETADKDVELLSYKDKLNNLNLINQAYSSNTDTGYYLDKKIYVYGDKIGILTDENNVPLQETTTNTGINLVTNTGAITTYFGGDVYDNGKSTNTGTTLINEINGAINNTLPCSPTTHEGYEITSLQDSQSGSFTKPLTITNGSGTGTIVATCNNGELTYGSESIDGSCNGSNYTWNGSSCDELYLDIQKSLRFDNTRSSYLSRTPTISGNRQKWTWSGWVKRSEINSSAGNAIFGAGNYGFEFDPNSPYDRFQWNSNAGSEGFMLSNQQFKDVSGWYHIVFIMDTTPGTTETIKVYINGDKITSWNTASYPAQNLYGNINSITSHTLGQYSNSRYYDGYMSDINFIDGQALGPEYFGQTVGGKWRPKTVTKSTLITGGTIFGDMFDKGGINAAFDGIIGQGYLSDASKNLGTVNGGYVGKYWSTEQSIRSAIVYPSNDRGWGGGSSVTVQIYGKNGTPSSSTDGTLLASQAGATALYNTSPISFGGLTGSYTHYWTRVVNTNTNEDLHVGEVLFYGDGVAYGVNGFHLDFSNSGNLGNDIVGNNDLTTSPGIQSYDQMIDTPTNNFNTISYTDRRQAGILSNGAMTYNGNTGVRWWRGTQTNLTSGKYYMEFIPNSSSRAYLGLGIAPSSNLYSDTDNVYPFKVTNGWGINIGSAGAGTDYWVRNNNSSMVNGNPGLATTNVLQMKIDLDNDIVVFGYDNVWVYTGSLNSSVPSWSIVGHVYNTAEYYFGQGGKSYLNWCSDAGGYFNICPPAGFKSLSSKNIGN